MFFLSCFTYFLRNKNIYHAPFYMIIHIKQLQMYGTERSPRGCFSCKGMLDFVEDFY